MRWRHCLHDRVRVENEFSFALAVLSLYICAVLSLDLCAVPTLYLCAVLAISICAVLAIYICDGTRDGVVR
jgi:hypothetical protein